MIVSACIILWPGYFGYASHIRVDNKISNNTKAQVLQIGMIYGDFRFEDVRLLV